MFSLFLVQCEREKWQCVKRRWKVRGKIGLLWSVPCSLSSRVRRASKRSHHPVTSFRQRNGALDIRRTPPDIQPQRPFPRLDRINKERVKNAVLQDDVHRRTLSRIREFFTRCFLLESVTNGLVGKQKHIKDLVTQSAMHVLDSGGTVRGFRYWGTRTLPQRMRRHKQFFNYGECVPFFPSRQGAARILALLPIPPLIQCARDN